MKELTVKQVDDGIAALDQLRERIIPKHFQTPVEVFKHLLEEYPDATHIRQVLMWDEKGGFLTLANYAVDKNGKMLGLPCNDSQPCPPFC